MSGKKHVPPHTVWTCPFLVLQLSLVGSSSVRVRNSDIAKFGTKNERDTDLAQYADRRTPKIQEKSLEQKIKNHKKYLLRKDIGSKTIERSRKQRDDVRVISSGRSCIFTTSNVARALKMRIPKKLLS